MDPSRRTRAGALLAVLLLGQSLANIDTAIVNVAAPSIHAHLGASSAELQLVVAGYVLAYALLMISGARLGHIHGYRRVYGLGIGAFTLASLACGLAPSPGTLIAARVVQGVGAALLVPQVLSSIQREFAGPERSWAVRWFVVALSTSAVIGQILGGVLIAADLFGAAWRPAFLINVPIGAGLILAARRYLPPDPPRRQVRLDLPGVAWLSAALLLALVPLVLGREAGWPAWTWVCVLLSGPAFGAFVVAERRATRGGQPLVDLALLARASVAWALAARAATSATYFSMLFVLALFLQQGLGTSPLFAGLALVAWVAAFGLAAPALRVAPAGARSSAARLGALAMALSFVLLGAASLGGQPSAAALVGALGVGGFGFGVVTAALLEQLMAAVPTEQAADLSGLYSASSQVAGVVGVATFGTTYLALGPLGAPAAFAATCGAMSLASLAAAFAAQRASQPPRGVPLATAAGHVTPPAA